MGSRSGPILDRWQAEAAGHQQNAAINIHAELFVQGARSVLQFREKQAPGLSHWLAQLLARAHQNVVVVALANNLVRTAWGVLCRNEIYRAPVLAAATYYPCLRNNFPVRFAGEKCRWQWVSTHALGNLISSKGRFEAVQFIARTKASGHPSWPGVVDSTRGRIQWRRPPAIDRFLLASLRRTIQTDNRFQE